MKVGYLGPEGTFSEEAGKVYNKMIKGRARMLPFTTIHDLLYAAHKKKINEAIVPVENSIEGTVGIVLDMLVKDVDLMIKQELIIPVYHYLISQKGVHLSEITDVISHPQAIEQCKGFLTQKIPKARLHLSYSTADAVRQVARSLGEKIIAHGKVKGPVFAAIGTKASARLYNLKIIANKINAKENQTRFLVLSKKDAPRSGKDKTSIVFSISKDRPGGLYQILGEFANRKINLTKIESRPSKKALGDYYFFMDMQGHRKDQKIKEAVAQIKRKVAFFKMLGSYPQSARKRS